MSTQLLSKVPYIELSRLFF